MLKKYFGITLLGAMIALSGCETMPTQTSASQISAINQANLVQRTWTATQLGNSMLKTEANRQNLPYLNFDATTQTVSGSDSCNRINASYTAGRDTLQLGQLATTRMACLNNNNLDQKFHEALNKVTHYQVYGKTLKLLDRHGNLLIQFETPTAVR
ncbi:MULTISPECIES: META domain-containing protein [Acinetobacter]|uniref:META domain-containing protein n=1 Tax=Acinetobacter TaxID=469 RepID=UPI0015B78A4B|nr:MULTISPECIES: META domain-containing protein [Acinetobacter]MBT0886919.1 META domain-containing protein [Acinetobacter towneri]NWJ92325.1 META domain-containing protein [Acinetobacter sp. Swhac1]WOE29178.1 META domain-containing protein [Acinetobacter towneri]